MVTQLPDLWPVIKVLQYMYMYMYMYAKPNDKHFQLAVGVHVRSQP